jgi:hypothetical protein
MKKFITFLCALFFLTAQAQLDHEPFGTQNVRAGFECMEESVFSQLPTLFTGWTSDSQWGYSVADDYTATSSFSVVRVFGGNYLGGVINPSETFLVEIFNGAPNAGGVLMHSFNKTAVPVTTGIIFNSTERYYVDIDLGQEITLLSGWIKIHRISTDNVYRFSWVAGDGGNAIQYFNSTGAWTNLNATMSFCLGNPAVVPVSNWALFIGLALILTFVIIRFRR